MLIVCNDCNVNYQLETMGFWMVELIEGEDRAVYRGDVYKCPSCDHKLTTDFGKPLTRDNCDDYLGLVTRILNTQEHIICNAR